MTIAFFGKKLGRHKSFRIRISVCLIGAILQATKFEPSHLIAGRIVFGIGIGFIHSTVPVLQAECSPEVSCGMYVSA